MSQYDYDVVGMRLPNGMISIVKNNKGSVGEVITEETFLSRYGHINEDASPSYLILESING